MPPRSELRLRIESMADIVSARESARELASEIGFSGSNLTLIATAIAEATRNIVEYANNGVVVLTPVRNGTKSGLKIVVSDEGPGIADLERVMRDGYSTVPDKLGIGLPGTRRLMDEFEITSKVGKGTVITMKKWNL